MYAQMTSQLFTALYSRAVYMYGVSLQLLQYVLDIFSCSMLTNYSFVGRTYRHLAKSTLSSMHCI